MTWCKALKEKADDLERWNKGLVRSHQLAYDEWLKEHRELRWAENMLDHAMTEGLKATMNSYREGFENGYRARISMPMWWQDGLKRMFNLS